MSCRVLGEQHERLQWRWLPREADLFTALSFSTVTASIMRETWLVTHIHPASPTVRAVLWASSSSPAVVLSTVSEFTNTVAAGISDNGQIVGYGFNDDFSRSRAFIWPSSTSQGIDLTTFFPAGSNWDLDSTFAIAVNNRGEIIGGGSFNGRNSPQLCADPGAWPLSERHSIADQDTTGCIPADARHLQNSRHLLPSGGFLFLKKISELWLPVPLVMGKESSVKTQRRINQPNYEK